MKESNWYGIKVCTLCEQRLTLEEIGYSSGVCPHCGNDSGTTMLDHKTVVLKKITHHKWWQFWKRKTTYIGKDRLSKRWLDERN